MARPADPHAHEALLKAARTEFARHGLDRARVEDIAKSAGLSKGAFYLHFDSKEDAFREILLRFTGVLEELAARRREAQIEFLRTNGPMLPGSVEPAKLHALMQNEIAADVEFLDVFWRNRDFLAALNSAACAAHRQLVEAFRLRMHANIAGDIRDRQQHGYVRTDLDAEALTDVLTGSFEAFMIRMPGMREKPDLHEWARTVRTILTQGLLPSAAPAASSAARRHGS